MSLRTRWISAALALAAPACGDTPGHEVEAAAIARTRNVVVFLVDTLRADHLGCYGYERDTSPNVDALAAEGVLFEDCLAQSSWTKPATASILTGDYPARHGATTADAALSTDVTTLAERASALGVRTAAFVSNNWINPGHGFARGFDTFRPLDLAPAGALVDAALEWLADVGDAPFLLYVHVIDPHDSYAAPAPFNTRFVAGGDGSAVTGAEKGEALRTLAGRDRERLIALYDGEIAYTDQEFGRFRRGLQELGRADDTALVFLADHGEAFGEHSGWRHNPMLFNEVVRVPLILRVPGVSSLRDIRYAGLVRQVDVAPTVLQLLGAEHVEELPGTSLLALAAGSAPESARDAYGLTEVEFHGRTRKAVVGGGVKYVRQYEPERREFLYDLHADPGELEDLLPSGRSVADRYAAILDQYIRATNAGFSILAYNGAEHQVVVTLLLGSTRGPLGGVRILNGEWVPGGQQDGPVTSVTTDFKGEKLYVTLVQLAVDPGDGDGAIFVPEADETVLVGALLDGEPVRLERFLLGPSLPATEAPIRVRADASELDAPRFRAREDLGDEPLRIRIWRNLSTGTDDSALTDESRAALKALGYLDDEE